MLHLALPVLAEEILTTLVGYTDWWLAGHYLGTASHKAAMGLMAYLLWLIPSLFAAISIGATALVARSVGAGETRRANRFTHQALLLGVVAASLVTAVAFLGGQHLIRWMRLEDESARLAGIYLYIVIPAIPFIMIEQVATACLRGAGDTASGFIAKSLVNVVNIIISTLLILGPGSIPQLGWQGLAIGTAVGHIIGGLLLLGLLIHGRAGLRLRMRAFRPAPHLIRRLLRIGLPGGIDVLAVLMCHMIYLAIINSLGTLSAAAHGLGVQIEAMAYMPGAAFAVAATTLAGQNLGAGRPGEAARAVTLTMFIGCSVMTVAAVVFYFGGAVLATFFTGNAEDPAGVLTAQLLKIVAIATPALGVVQILTGGLRGAGDTRVPLAITFVGLAMIRIPLACFLAWETIPLLGTDVVFTGLGWGVKGAWWAMTVDVIIRGVLTAMRFFHGGWKSIDV